MFIGDGRFATMGGSAESRSWWGRGLDEVAMAKGLAVFTWLLGFACVGLFLGWAPHYLTWPWWPDQDTNAVMARAWARGILPYRDIVAFTFPGQIYVFRLLDELGGAGRTWPLMALDAAMVAWLCVLFVAWSRRIAGVSTPGWMASLAFLNYYLGLNFSLAAQRDWQAAFLVLTGLMFPVLARSRVGVCGSAVSLGMAMVFRPHALVFVPAVLLGACSRDGGGDGVVESRGGRRVAGLACVWLTVFGSTVCAGFLPLVWAGVAGDFVAGLRLASYGGPYSRTSLGGMVGNFWRQAMDLRYVSIPLFLAMAWWVGVVGGRLRREVGIWLVAAVGVAFYKPLHPVNHDYLAHPAWVTWAGLLGLVAMVVMRSGGWEPSARLGALFLLLGLAMPGRPAFFHPRASVAALEGLLEGRPGESEFEPPGYAHHMARYQVFLPPWRDYRDLMRYLREETESSTMVANLLRYQLALNGATGRASPFRNESGLLWLTQVGWSEERFMEDMRAAGEVLVVCSHEEEGPDPGFRYPRLMEAMETEYEPARRFGRLEVWRRVRRATGGGSSVGE